VALIEDVGIPAPDWSARLVEAHRGPFAGVGGAIETASIARSTGPSIFATSCVTRTRCWRANRPSPATPTYPTRERRWNRSGPCGRSSFTKRRRTARCARGQKLALAPHAVLYKHRQGLRLKAALKERFVGPIFWWHTREAGRDAAAGALGRAFAAPSRPDLGSHDPDGLEEAAHPGRLPEGSATHRGSDAGLVRGRVCRVRDRTRQRRGRPGGGGYRSRFAGRLVANEVPCAAQELGLL